MFSKDAIDVSRERSRVYQQVQRAIEENVPATLTIDEWLDTLVLFQGLCVYCKEKPFQTLDHLVPVCSGGGTTQNNCVPACLSCNSRKGSKIGDDISEVTSLLDAVEKVSTSLHQNPDIKRYRGPYAKWGDMETNQVRFPLDVWETIRTLAEQHERSFNGEVIWALREYIKREEEEGKDANKSV